MIYSIMTDSQVKNFEEHWEADFSTEVKGIARFRVNVFNQNRGLAVVFRTIPSRVLSLEDLKAPEKFVDIIDVPRGLVLVTGPTGSGKSTTLAAMLNHINENRHEHILTIEDPGGVLKCMLINGGQTKSNGDPVYLSCGSSKYHLLSPLPWAEYKAKRQIRQ